MTAADFDHIVVGRGLIGAAAARHLSLGGERVAVIGPEEPADRFLHTGVFGSHYDEGRITRVLEPDPIWALLAQRSIARYHEVEQDSGVGFYHDVGHLMVVAQPQGPDDYGARVQRVADDLGVAYDTLTGAALAERFPYLAFEPGVVGFHQPQDAGHVSPRAQVRAQTRAAERHGATVIHAVARRVRAGTDHATVTLASGEIVRGRRALVATGGFSNASGLLPARLDIEVYARTIVLVELADTDVERLIRIPSMIYRPRDVMQACYVLPPIRYPDGKWYLKIGGRTNDAILDSLADLQEWFRGPGDTDVADCLIDRLHAIVPGLRPVAVRTDSCVTTHTPTGHVYADRLDSGRVGVVIGGNGSAAKSADELGRLGATMMRHDDWAYDLPAQRFTARVRA